MTTMEAIKAGKKVNINKLELNDANELLHKLKLNINTMYNLSIEEHRNVLVQYKIIFEYITEAGLNYHNKEIKFLK